MCNSADGRSEQGKINTLNQLIKDRVEDMDDVDFVDNDRNFKYRDDTTDTSLLLADGLHVSYFGIKKLLQNLGLSDMAETRLRSVNVNTDHISPSSNPIQSPPYMQSQHKPITKPPHTQPQYIPPMSAHMQGPTVSASHGPTHTSGYVKFSQGGGDRAWSHSASQRPPHRFKGQHDLYSNFSYTWVNINDHYYPTTEHAYQHRKAIVMKDWIRADQILRAPTPQDAKYYGGQVKTDNYWHSIKAEIMYEILCHKVEQSAEFANRLKNSMGQQLIESTNHEYWAEGASGNGRNVLGNLLMLVREQYFGKSSSHPKSYATKSTQPSCFNCSETGHLTHSCGHQGPIQCHKCKLIGHKSKSCPY